MLCVHCQREIVDESVYCAFCGARQQGNRPQDNRRLRRSTSEKRIAGVCGGLAEYFNVDISLVRLAWVVPTIVPGAIFFGVLAYLAAWVLMPESKEVQVAKPASAKRLARSATDRKIGGVCGVLAYFVAWLVMPNGTCTRNDRQPRDRFGYVTTALRPTGGGLGTGKGAAAVRPGEHHAPAASSRSRACRRSALGRAPGRTHHLHPLRGEPLFQLNHLDLLLGRHVVNRDGVIRRAGDVDGLAVGRAALLAIRRCHDTIKKNLLWWPMVSYDGWAVAGRESIIR